MLLTVERPLLQVNWLSSRAFCKRLLLHAALCALFFMKVFIARAKAGRSEVPAGGGAEVSIRILSGSYNWFWSITLTTPCRFLCNYLQNFCVRYPIHLLFLSSYPFNGIHVYRNSRYMCAKEICLVLQAAAPDTDNTMIKREQDISNFIKTNMCSQKWTERQINRNITWTKIE